MAFRWLYADGSIPGGRGAARRRGVIVPISRVVDYLFGVLYVLLGSRFVLEALSARRDTGFFELVARLTDPFYGPFKGIVPIRDVEGTRVVWPLVVAIVAYLILHAGIRALLRVAAR